MSERGDLAQELCLNTLARDEEVDRLDPGRQSRADDILTLGGEEPALVAVLPRREKLPDEPELLVLARTDQAAFEASPSSSAAFAVSATRANASGSETAISASDLRSSSIPAFFTPAIKRL